MKYIVFISAGLGAVLLYLLSHASANMAESGHYYTVLLGLNIALASLMILLIFWQLWRLYRQLKLRVMGSRLTFRLLGAFALMAIIPGLVVYLLSVNFLTRSIESWFNVKVEAALDGGLRLGQSTLDIMLNDMEEKGNSMALALSLQPASSHRVVLNDLREKSGVQDAVLFTMQGQIVAFSSNDPSSFLPELPSLQQLRDARLHPVGKVDPIPDKGLYMRLLVPVSVPGLIGETRILQLLHPVPHALSTTAEEVQAVYQDYQELSFSRESLKDVFALTLTLVLMLSMLTAVAIAFVLSRRLSAPLSLLAEGTRAIARGDYDTMLPEHGRDELGVLVQSFNSMTRQLAEATQAAARNQMRVEAARSYLETVLAHLSSGVLALNEHAELRASNPAAAHILGLVLENRQPFAHIAEQKPELTGFVETVLQHFQLGDPAAARILKPQRGEWREQIEVYGASGTQVILLRGTQLPEGADRGFVLVFDDMTTTVQAQRDAAWGEVARRLAHEIKNPLTPIQLSAERLERKLAPRLDAADGELLKRTTHTIVSQVSAMKTMVNEFSEYARAPVLNLSALDINQLIEDVLGLYEPGGAEATGIRIESELQPDLPQVQGDATMLRQVLHNLLKNAQDALQDKPVGRIQMRSKLQDQQLRVSVTDNGDGFPPNILARAFEPYTTTKRHGTGLGLAIVKKIMEEHGGSVKIENLEAGGACVSIAMPLTSQAWPSQQKQHYKNNELKH
ncbi:sensor histidine kinase [Methylobacillus flagellatus]|uniref:sensor histidine kinase n=1 Tax=Methylobacillus flagellatus TaxID=405 RepID=UPI0010F6F640|nr:ATP-binding protein [Methylobacillus flagellatus]